MSELPNSSSEKSTIKITELCTITKTNTELYTLHLQLRPLLGRDSGGGDSLGTAANKSYAAGGATQKERHQRDKPILPM